VLALSVSQDSRRLRGGEGDDEDDASNADGADADASSGATPPPPPSPRVSFFFPPARLFRARAVVALGRIHR
jgi:hypothetical protein